VRILNCRNARRRHGLERPIGAPFIDPVSATHLRERLDRVADFLRIKDGKPQRIMPPATVARTLVERGEWPRLRHLQAVIETPTLRRNGSILEVAGYDELSQLFYMPSGPFPIVPRHPNRAAAREAIRKPAPSL
jgi:putative DNA primase/helicase